MRITSFSALDQEACNDQTHLTASECWVPGSITISGCVSYFPITLDFALKESLPLAEPRGCFVGSTVFLADAPMIPGLIVSSLQKGTGLTMPGCDIELDGSEPWKEAQALTPSDSESSRSVLVMNLHSVLDSDSLHEKLAQVANESTGGISTTTLTYNSETDANSGQPSPVTGATGQSFMEVNTTGRRISDALIGVAETCNLTDDITYASEYPFAHGGYSDVYLGDLVVKHTNEAKGIVVEEHVAVVIKALRAYTRDMIDMERARKANACAQRLNREVNILRRLSHANIAEFMGISFKMELRPCIIIKYYKNGTATKYLEDNPYTDRLGMIRDVADGLAYLHTLEPPVVHGDLKGCNILVKDDGHVVLTDFGLARIIEDYSGPTGFTTTTLGGSIRWCAPELLFDPTVDFSDASTVQDDDAARNPTLHSDIWSFGCTAYELFTDLNPYSDDRYDWNIMQSLISRRRPSTKRNSAGRDKWLKDSTEVFNLLCQCWSYVPTARPTIQTIVEGLRNAVMAPVDSL
ncbi:hypothetical protein NMY22_g17751 [Coprinellus aureogranulatus]|nr:hypothetical protein NMY22_g17751 [Coprinellus aureogranulatus]